LIVPVLKNSEEKNFPGPGRAHQRSRRASPREKLKPEEVQEELSRSRPRHLRRADGLPVINQPNVAILGIGAFKKRPMVIDDGDRGPFDGVSDLGVRPNRCGTAAIRHRSPVKL